ncbi:MAG: plasmid stabilization protein, partial [Candidatus Gracilibacteria bacterium]|nr:plasmid stabilization protein [Candidatus Gracilibacteria bacterium]
LLKYGFDYPSLRSHKLKGKLSFVFSLSVNMSFRALFYKNKKDNEVIIEFFSIGNHDIYKK